MAIMDIMQIFINYGHYGFIINHSRNYLYFFQFYDEFACFMQFGFVKELFFVYMVLYFVNVMGSLHVFFLYVYFIWFAVCFCFVCGVYAFFC